MLARQFYLDANAHVPMSARSFKAFQEFNNSLASHGHPSSPSVAGRAAARAVESARAEIARGLGADKPQQIIFTNSCTQACEWGMKMLARTQGTLFVSPIEHPAVSQGCEAALGSIYSKLKVTPEGIVEGPDYSAGSISCIHLQNEIGTIQDIAAFKKDLPQVKVFSDISQSLGKIDVDVNELQVDFAAAGAHKFGGPSGVGFLYIRNLDDWIQFGSGSRYFMDIAGTPNVAGIVATAVALTDALETRAERAANGFCFQAMLEPKLEELGFEIIAKNSPRSWNTTFVKSPVNALSLMLELGNLGVHVGLGSACGSLYTGGSPLMQALGRDSDGQEYMRISQWGKYNDKDANLVIDKFHKAIKKVSG